MDGYNFTEADLRQIRTARLRGVRTVTFGDRTTTYASDAEMRTVESDILRELNSRRETPVKQFRAVGSKGLGCF